MDHLAARNPARQSVMIEDKLHLRREMTAIQGGRLATICVRQGRYPHDERVVSTAPPTDVAIDAIGNLEMAILGLQSLPLQPGTRSRMAGRGGGQTVSDPEVG